MATKEPAGLADCECGRIGYMLVLCQELDGQFRNSLTGDDWAYHILAIPLAAAVPDELRRLFEVARGTMLYGWFFYPAYTLASEQVLRVAEAAVAYPL